jgi:ubiquinone/menaquinone biosynthesis C-methylase UbiE
VNSDVLAYYNEGREARRLTTYGRLEFLRTQELLTRYLPAPPAFIVDVGGGAGIHAVPLLDRGYDVTLFDPVELHVRQAHDAGVQNAFVGDARQLQLESDLADAVLLLGPLYHLTEFQDRLRALEEARRVTRPGGLVIAAGISRFASTYDGVTLKYLDNAEFEVIVENDVSHGQHRNPTAEAGWFTTAYFHRPDELASELIEAGWSSPSVVAIEGPGTFADMEFWLENPTRQDALLRAIRRIESEPSICGASPHFVAIAQKH